MSQYADRAFLKATRFIVDNVWHGPSPLDRRTKGVLLKLSPVIPELESFHSAVGLMVFSPSVGQIEYEAGSRDEQGHLIFFFKAETCPFQVGDTVSLQEQALS